MLQISFYKILFHAEVLWDGSKHEDKFYSDTEAHRSCIPLSFRITKLAYFSQVLVYLSFFYLKFQSTSFYVGLFSGHSHLYNLPAKLADARTAFFNIKPYC